MANRVKAAVTAARVRSGATKPAQRVGNVLELTENALAIAMSCH